jgi:putative CocE/NonD family hydrolase
MKTAVKWILPVLLWLLPVRALLAQQFDFHPPASAGDPATAAVMRDLATRMLPVYQEQDTERYLNNVSALQFVSGSYAPANASRQQLRDRRRTKDTGRPVTQSLLIDLYLRAKAVEASAKVPFAQAFTQEYKAVIPKLDDLDAYRVGGWLGAPVATAQDALQKLFDQHRAQGTVSLAEALELVWGYLTLDAYRSVSPVTGPLNAEEDQRRYENSDDIVIKTSDGTMLSAVMVKPRDAPKALPALLEFTIRVSPQNRARQAAAHGYVGVVAYTRGKYKSADPVIPFQHDGADARAVIEWITRQPWSDGRVGMYGSGYSAFTAWAALKHPPAGLKAIATAATTAPGIETPMEAGVFHNSAYRWVLSVTDPKPEEDDAHWRALDKSWYTSGKAYRELDVLNGRQSRFFRRWLNHPSYDRFWQSMVPYRQDFARVTIPILAMGGYYDPSLAGTLYFFNQHYRYNPRANQTLLLGPYDDTIAQHDPPAVLRGYSLDPAAVVDLDDLRFDWFDHVIRGRQRPPLLSSRVNYEVMGSNEWRHGTSVETMGRGAVKFYLDAAIVGDAHRLSQRRFSETTYVEQTVNLADRSDADWRPPADLVGKTLQTHNAATFMSAPLTHALELHGPLAGRLDFRVNKMDMDITVALYELLPSGEYLQLSAPVSQIRASYAQDRERRHLLKAGERQQLIIHCECMTSRKLQEGSRVVVVLGVNKRADQEINYGTGGDVSTETIEDAKVPLKVRWFSDSYIDIPVRR